ncbi:unnamed protein product [Agarophyton chilense]
MEKTPPKSFYRRKLPKRLTDLNTEEGKKRFSSALQSSNAEAFFPLISQLQTQAHPAFCGLTSLSTVLNALEIDPKRVWAHPWRWFAESLLDCCLDIERVKVEGMTMDQLARTAQCQGSVVKVLRHLSIDETRNIIKRSVRGRANGSFEFVIASYDRRALGQTGTGHFSPVAAYDENTDSVLVLDVARFKYGPHWVHLPDLVEATKPTDSSTGLPRGFMTLRKMETGGNGGIELCNLETCSSKCGERIASPVQS